MDQIKQYIPPSESEEQSQQQEEEEQKSILETTIPIFKIEGKKDSKFELKDASIKLFPQQLLIEQPENKSIIFQLESIQSYGKSKNDLLIFLTDDQQNDDDYDEEDDEEEEYQDEIIQLIKEQQSGQVVNVGGNYDLTLSFQDEEKYKEFQSKLAEQMAEIQQDGGDDINNIMNFNPGDMITAEDIDEEGNIIEQEDSEEYEDEGEENQEEEAEQKEKEKESEENPEKQPENKEQ